MRTKLFGFVALCLCVLLIVSGCSMIEVDQEMDDAEAVAIVNGEVITKLEARNLYYSYANLYSQIYGSLTADILSYVQSTVIDQLVSDRLILQKGREMGLDVFTDEEQQEIQTESEASFEGMITSYESEVTKEGMTDEEIREATIQYLNQNGVTIESYVEEAKRQRIRERVEEEVGKDVEVTDEEVQTKYDEQVIADESTYANSPYAFESEMMKENTVSWMPEGYRTIKHILIKFSEEQQTQFDALSDELSAIEDQIADLEAAAEEDTDDEGEAEETETPEPTETPETADTPTAEGETIESLNAKKADIEAQIKAFNDAFLLEIQPKVDEINAKLAEGVDFDALIVEYGEDSGMTTEPMKTTGYFVSANSAAYDEAFVSGAMALSAVGDVSEPVMGMYGAYIMRYHSDVTPGAVPLEQLRDQMAEASLETKKSEAFDTALETWLSEAKIEKYPDRLS